MDERKPRLEFCEFCGTLYVEDGKQENGTRPWDGYNDVDLTEALKLVSVGICIRPECRLRYKEKHRGW